MRAVVQRVSRAAVCVGPEKIHEIADGLLVYLGVMQGDDEKDVDYLVRKVTNLRVFADSADKLNESVLDKQYEILLISQFTICGNVKKGNRPSFDASAAPEDARRLYESVAAGLRNGGLQVGQGVFQAYMEISSVNVGPVTILLDSRKLF